jgi:hypothetical protein
MITLLLAFVALAIAAIFVRSHCGVRRRYTVHVLAVSAALLIAIARAASSGHLGPCALDLPATCDRAVAKVHR